MEKKPVDIGSSSHPFILFSLPVLLSYSLSDLTLIYTLNYIYSTYSTTLLYLFYSTLYTLLYSILYYTN